MKHPLGEGLREVEVAEAFLLERLREVEVAEAFLLERLRVPCPADREKPAPFGFKEFGSAGE
jgi:hypothetical protein